MFPEGFDVYFGWFGLITACQHQTNLVLTYRYYMLVIEISGYECVQIACVFEMLLQEDRHICSSDDYTKTLVFFGSQ